MPKPPEITQGSGEEHPLREGAEMIRVPLTALFAAAGFWMIDHVPASGQTGISQYPFCIQGVDNPGWSGCSLNSLGARQASASGTEAECLTNPWYHHLLRKNQRAWVGHFRLGAPEVRIILGRPP